MEGPDAGRVRLDLADPVCPDLGQSPKPIGEPSALQLLQTGKLGLVERDDELSAKPIREFRRSSANALSASLPTRQRRAFSEPGE
jgi:hypothetical protein